MRYVKTCGLILLAFSLGGLAEVGTPITVETARHLSLETAFDAGLTYFQVYFVTDDELAVAGTDRFLFWDISLPEPGLAPTGRGDGHIVCLSPDRSRFALFTRSHAVEIWSVDPLERQASLGALEDTTWTHGTFSPNGRFLAMLNRWNEVDVWDLESVDRVLELSGLRSNVFDLAFSPDGRMLAGAGGGSSRDDHGVSLVCVWDVAAGTLIASLPTDDVGDNHAITFSGDGSRLVTAGIFRILAWETESWQRTYDSRASHPGSYGISVAPDGRLLAVASDARSILLIDLETMHRVRTIATGVDVLNVDFSPDGSKLAASCMDGTVRIWTIR